MTMVLPTYAMVLVVSVGSLIFSHDNGPGWFVQTMVPMIVVMRITSKPNHRDSTRQ